MKRELYQVGGRAFEAEKTASANAWRHESMFQEQGEDIQRKEAKLGRAVGLVYIRRLECQGRTSPCSFFSQGWLVWWASYLAVVENIKSLRCGFLPLNRHCHCVMTSSSVSAVTSYSLGSPAHSSDPLLERTLPHPSGDAALMRLLTSAIYSGKIK